MKFKRSALLTFVLLAGAAASPTAQAQTAPIIPHYAKSGILRTVDGMADIDDVARQIDAVLETAS